MDITYYWGNIEDYTVLHTTIIQIIAYWAPWRREDLELALTRIL